MRRPSARPSMETSKKKTTEIATAAAQRKLRKRERGDRLSSLPDEILCHILSFLPTKYAVGTSGLSRRWKDLWTGLYELDLDNKDDYNRFEFRKRRALEFCRFVDRVLREHKDLNSLRRLRIHFAMWAEYTKGEARPNILLTMGSSDDHQSRLEELDLRNVGSALDMGWLPETFHRLKLLKVLKLVGVTLTETTATKGSVILLPSVKILQIVSVQITDAKLLSNLISGCPVLETLHVEDCDFAKKRKGAIVTASLRIVGLALLLCPLRIEAPRLEHLYVRGFTALELLDSTSSPLPCLHSAKVDFGGCPKHGLIRLLARISNAKEMELSWWIMSFLFGGDVYEEDDDDDDVQLPIFPNLTHLTIQLGINLRHLHPFLKAAPRLQYLRIDLEDPYEQLVHIIEFAQFEKPACAPECLLLSLEAIDINNVRTDGFDLDMVSYLLEAGAVLKKVNVHLYSCDDDDDDDERYREDRAYRPLKAKRRSSDCEVHVFRDYGREIHLDSDDDNPSSDDDTSSSDDDSSQEGSLSEEFDHYLRQLL